MNLKETLRYLGCRGGKADGQTLKLARECWKELEESVEKRSCFREFPLSFQDGIIDMGCFQTESRALGKNVRGCRQVVLFAATLGAQADNLIRRYSRLQMSKAVVMQAAAAAMLEDYCDQVNDQLRREYEKKGMHLRPRFSPGYGDFPLECQPALIRGLEAGKRIGITLTDSLLMAPSKSVTAVIGVYPAKQRQAAGGGLAKQRQDAGDDPAKRGQAAGGDPAEQRQDAGGGPAEQRQAAGGGPAEQRQAAGGERPVGAKRDGDGRNMEEKGSCLKEPGQEGQEWGVRGCGACNKTDCLYRREDI